MFHSSQQQHTVFVKDVFFKFAAEFNANGLDSVFEALSIDTIDKLEILLYF